MFSEVLHLIFDQISDIKQSFHQNRHKNGLIGSKNDYFIHLNLEMTEKIEIFRFSTVKITRKPQNSIKIY